MTVSGASSYGGPCPPPGRPHRDVVRSDALDANVAANASMTGADRERARTDHVLARAMLTFCYGRRRELP